MELTYERRGDYYFPVFSLPEETRPIGLWGRRRREYLKEHRTITFNIMVMNGTLYTHLADINEQAEARLALIIEQLKEAEGITEAMKAADHFLFAIFFYSLSHIIVNPTRKTIEKSRTFIDKCF